METGTVVAADECFQTTRPLRKQTRYYLQHCNKDTHETHRDANISHHTLSFQCATTCDTADREVVGPVESVLFPLHHWWAAT
jgi:hypothetical protein